MKLPLFILFIIALPFVAIGNIETMTLNGQWNFQRSYEKEGIENKWYERKLNKWPEKTLEVPGCWPIQLNENLKDNGVAWYARNFKAPKGWDSSRVTIAFEAVCLIADVWVNGKYVGKHLGAYTSFELEVNKRIDFNGENTIVVRCDSTRTSGQAPASVEWLYPGGITGAVTLQKKSFLDLNDCWLYRLNGNTHLDLNFKNHTSDSCKVEYTVKIKSGKSLTKGQGEISARKTKDFKAVIKESLPIWSMNNPQLIELEITVNENGKEWLYKHKTGLREISWKKNQIKINNERTWLQGMALHLDHPEGGQVWTDKQMNDCFERLEAFNVNFFRMGHYPFPQKWLEECDRRGIVVWLEIPNWQSGRHIDSEKFQKRWLYPQLKEMIKQFKRHPCVIAWSHGNENGSHSSFYKDGCDYIRSLDKTRPASFSTSPYNREQDWQYRDIHGQITHFGWYHSKTPYRINSYIDHVFNYHKGAYLNIEICAHSRDVDGGYASNTRQSSAYHDKVLRVLFNAYYKNCDRIEGVTAWTLNDFLWRRESKDYSDFYKNNVTSSHGLFTRERKAKYPATTVRELYRGDVKALVVDEKTFFSQSEPLEVELYAAVPNKVIKPIEVEWRAKCWRANKVFYQKKGKVTLTQRGAVKIKDVAINFPEGHSGLTLFSLSLHKAGSEEPINRQVAHYDIENAETLDYRMIYAKNEQGDLLNIRAGANGEFEYGDEHTPARYIIWPGENKVWIHSKGYHSKGYVVAKESVRGDNRNITIVLKKK